MTGNINSNFKKTNFDYTSEQPRDVKRKRDEDEDTHIVENQHEKDIQQQQGLEGLTSMFQGLQISKLSLNAQNILNEIPPALNNVTMDSARDVCFKIYGLLDQFCTLTASETYEPNELRTIKFMQRAFNKASLLCQQGHFTPKIAQETLFTLLHEEFSFEKDLNQLSEWLKDLLKNCTCFKIINTHELMQLGWTEIEIQKLLEHSVHTTALDLSGTPQLDITKITFTPKLRSIAFSSQQKPTQEIREKILSSCEDLYELKIDGVNMMPERECIIS